MHRQFLAFFLLISSFAFAQKTQYRATATLPWDLIHTKLEVTPDWQKQYLNGKATLTLRPYFYSQDTIKLDAKGFDIRSVELGEKTLAYKYDGKVLTIPLATTYDREDTVRLSINYTAKPNELEVKGSDAITQDKGLYFIDPAAPNRQLWTQGETEANSCWFPTFDHPNEKHTQEIYLRVDKNLTTLSNGELAEQTNHNDGTRTDHWVMKKPHSVYLTMMAAGNFTKTVDPNFEDFEVSYYVEPDYALYAEGIFGRTPEMIRFYEDLLGVKYPWNKYSQVAVREYVSGAMENTTATVHGDFVLKNFNQLVDNNDDGVITHELFHHWFGDLVTAESWSNLPLNESFADYSEYLWATYKYGPDEGDYVALKAMGNYLQESQAKQVPLIRYYYNDREDMFDAHSYSKGGRVLHMLRRVVGDDAFFRALNRYLTENAYKTAEIHTLRMAFEAETGEDLNWFFNQWFLAQGHPRLDVETYYKDKTLTIEIDQTLDSVNALVYRLPLEVLIGTANGTETKEILLNSEEGIFTIPLATPPTFVLIDPRGELVGQINHPKSQEQLIMQYQQSPYISGRIRALEMLNYTDEASDYAPDPLQNKAVRDVTLEATNDEFWGIRDMAVQKFFDYDGDDFLQVEKTLQSLIKTDPNAHVRGDAILAMKNFLNPQNDILFREALKDTSYIVRGAALQALLVNNPPDAAALVARFENISDVNIFASVASYYADEADPARLSWFTENLEKLSDTDLYSVMGIFGTYLVQSDADVQRAAVAYLKNMGMNHPQYFLRYAGTQTLLLIDDIPQAKNAIREILQNETDERLKQVYATYPLD